MQVTSRWDVEVWDAMFALGLTLDLAAMTLDRVVTNDSERRTLGKVREDERRFELETLVDALGWDAALAQMVS